MADIEETRAVVDADETYDGKIIPTQQTAIDRPVRIREGATVQGSVYGTSVSTNPDASIDGSVMASESVELSGGHVKGEVGTPGKVVCNDARIDGTVTGKKVRLQGCVVRGNVVGTDVILEDSVVLGIATADRKLIIEDSLCYTFRGLDEVRVDGAITVLPQVIVSGDFELQSPIRVAGLGELEVEEQNRLPKMTEDDLYTEDGSKYLTLAPRVLNLSKVQDRLTELENGIMDIVNDTSDEETATSIADLLERLDIDGDEIASDIGALE